MALPLPSKRTEKRAKVLAKTGDIGSNDKAKGLVRIQDVQLQHFLNSLKKWIPAMYHNDIREELIAESEALGDYGIHLENRIPLRDANPVRSSKGERFRRT